MNDRDTQLMTRVEYEARNQISWHTDGQGNSWGHFPEETINLHWSVIFVSGLFIGVVLASVVCLVPW